MTVFLLIASLLLNITALLAIVILYLRQNKLLQVDVQQKQNLKNMEEMISAYLLEMKDENDRFIMSVQNLSNEKKTTEHAPKQVSFEEETEEQELRQPEISRKPGKVMTFRAVKAYQQTQKQHATEGKIKNEEILDSVEISSFPGKKGEEPKIAAPTLEDQLFMMKQEGISVDEMAKRLNKGKTEIELLLKFRENMQE